MIESLIVLILYAVVLAAVGYILVLIVGMVPIPSEIQRVLVIVIWVVVALGILLLLLRFVGHMPGLPG